MRALAPILAAFLLGGCLVDVNFDDTNFTCNDGKCPDGFACVSGMCVAMDGGGAGEDGGGVDAGGDASVLLTCDEQFGAAGGYTLCEETETTCEFFVQVEVAATCTDICAIYENATCTASYDANGGGTECTRETADEACAVTHSGQICVCSRNAPAG